MRPAFFCLLLYLIGCGGEMAESPDDAPLYFVHLTDPHLYDPPSPDSSPEDQARLAREREFNRLAFERTFAQIASLIKNHGVRPRFLAVTGDFGIEPPAGASAEQLAARNEANLTDLVDLLKQSPVKDIYLVWGNNDVADESPEEAQTRVTADFFRQARARLKAHGVRLFDLTACYAGGEEAGCYEDVPGADLRLIGAPSFSFKSEWEGEAAARQIQHMKTFAELVKRSADQGRSVIALSHVSEIEDPFSQVMRRYSASGSAEDTDDFRAVSPWRVGDEVWTAWREALERDAMLGVLAGHFHDSHKEIYRQPYDWTPASASLSQPKKLFLAPPLAARLQYSPIQARGFSLLSLQKGRLESAQYWYDETLGLFSLSNPEAVVVAEIEEKNSFFYHTAIRWMWRFGDDPERLSNDIVMALAFLIALLTVVQIWQIPPSSGPLTINDNEKEESEKREVSAAGPFGSNVGRVVLGGLSGFIAITFLDDFWGDNNNNKLLYIVAFVLYFVAFLLLSALFRGFMEGWRSRLIIKERYSAKRERAGGSGQNKCKFFWCLFYSMIDFREWVFSWHSFFMVFMDTFFNVIQGKNQMRSVVFTDQIVEMQWSKVKTAEAVRRSIETVIRDSLRHSSSQNGLSEKDGGKKECEQIGEPDVRVSISLLSRRRNCLYYVATTPYSLGNEFNSKSIAWLAVYNGRALWWKKSYPKSTLLGDDLRNKCNEIIDSPTIEKYYQNRSGDYDAFMMLPLPWRRRGSNSGQRVGIHIAFRKEQYMDEIWSSLDGEISGSEAVNKTEENSEFEPVIKSQESNEKTKGESGAEKGKKEARNTKNEPDFEQQDHLLNEAMCQKAEVRAVLYESIHVLNEVLSGLNERVYKEYILPKRIN